MITHVFNKRINSRPMAVETSLTSVPEAPTAPPYASSHKSPFLHDSKDPTRVQMKLSIPSEYEQMYPKLLLEVYHLRSASKPSNVLAFVHNAAKREVADLLTVILPSLQQSSQNLLESRSHTVNLPDLQTWWSAFLRFLFFVAETDDDIVRMTTERVAKLAKRLGDFKRFNAMHRRRKSLGDRYSFTMEVVFRAADTALKGFVFEPSSEGLTKTVNKLRAASEFMLDTMDLSKRLVADAESFCDLEFNKLEYTIAESLYSFARSEISVFVCQCARWLEDEKLIRCWIQKHCGIRGRLYADKWMRSYAEGRGKFVSELKLTSTDDS